jgi:alpha-L-fucosidase
VAILCAALVVIPAFLERHWPKVASIFNSKASPVGSTTANTLRQFQEDRSKKSSRLQDMDDTLNESAEQLTGLKPTLGHITVTHDVEMNFINSKNSWANKSDRDSQPSVRC